MTFIDPDFSVINNFSLSKKVEPHGSFSLIIFLRLYSEAFKEEISIKKIVKLKNCYIDF